jgi:hypothetical protein
MQRKPAARLLLFFHLHRSSVEDGWMDGSLPFVLQMFYSSIVELRMWTSSSSSQHEREVFFFIPLLEQASYTD